MRFFLSKLKQYWIKFLFNPINKFGLNKNEFYIVSFPKSGNTWIRIILTNILNPQNKEGVFLKEIQSFIPDFHDKNQIKSYFKNNIYFDDLDFKFIKTHNRYSKFFRKKNIIYIVRDGRDVYNSYYHYLNARSNKNLTLKNIIQTPDEFGYWSDHVKNWIDGEKGKFFIIRYEDLLNDPEKYISQLLQFIGLNISNKELSLAIEKSSFDRLTKMEDVKGVQYKNKLKDKKSKFFREGKSKGWQKSFSKNDLNEFNKLNNQAMELFGYYKD